MEEIELPKNMLIQFVATCLAALITILAGAIYEPIYILSVIVALVFYIATILAKGSYLQCVYYFLPFIKQYFNPIVSLQKVMGEVNLKVVLAVLISAIPQLSVLQRISMSLFGVFQFLAVFSPIIGLMYAKYIFYCIGIMILRYTPIGVLPRYIKSSITITIYLMMIVVFILQ